MEIDKRSPDEEVNVTFVSDKVKVKSTPKSSVRKARSQSPTIARLTAVCAKLDAYLTFLLTGTSTEKLAEHPPTVEVQPTARDSSSARLRKRAKVPKPLVTQPQEKITYASTQTLNGDTKHKCSVEIWLPCVGADGDDDQNSTRVVSRDPTIVDAVPSRSRPWSTNRILSGTAYGDPLAAEHLSSHSSTATLASLAPQHHNLSSNRLSKRAHSSRTMSTSKTDAQTSSDRSKQTRPRRLSKDTFQSVTTKASMTSRMALPDLDRGFYSSEKRPGRRARRQFEHVRHTSDQAERARKDAEPLPPITHPAVAFRIILGNTLPVRSAADYNIIDPKLFAYCASNEKPLASDRSSSPKIKHIQTSATTKKSDDAVRPAHHKPPSRLIIHSNHIENVSSSSNLLSSVTNSAEYPSNSSVALPLLLLRSEQQPSVPYRLRMMQPHKTPRSPAPGAATSRQPVHLKYSKGQTASYNCLTPK